MTPMRLTAAGLGVAFGFALAWSGMTDPDLIRRMLLLEDAYFFLVMFSSMAVAFTGVRASFDLELLRPPGDPVADALANAAMA
jgi:hypothetical protein